MRVPCPHCGKDIELLGTTEITKVFGLTQNMVQHAQNRGLFPDAWIRFANRAVWLRSDIEAFVQQRNRMRVERVAKSLSESLTGMSAEEREEMLRMLQEEIAANPTSAKRSRKAQ